MASNTLANMREIVQVTLNALHSWDTWSWEKTQAVRSPDFTFRALPPSLGQKEVSSEDCRAVWEKIMTDFKKFYVKSKQQIFDVDSRKAVVYVTVDLTIPNGQEWQYDMIQTYHFSEDGKMLVRLEEFFDSKHYLEVLAALGK